MNDLKQFDEYVEFLGTWQTILLNIADKIVETNNLYLRILYREELVEKFSLFIKELNEKETQLFETQNDNANIQQKKH
jgi:hypothetical protein